MDPRHTPVDVEIVVPVYNEAPQLAERIIALRTFLDESFPFRSVVTIVDNASTDDTFVVATALVTPCRAWRPCISTGRAGASPCARRGRRAAPPSSPTWTWTCRPRSRRCCRSWRRCSPVTATWPSARAWPAAPTSVRGPKRELISRTYNLILRMTLRGRFSDAQCGFKALRRDAAERILPLVEDNQWFFDTELLVMAERLGLRIGEVPVDWVDDPDSRVNIVSTATDDLRGIWRMLVRRPKGLPRATVARGHVRPAAALRRRRPGQHARLPVPLRGLAPRPRGVRGQRGGHGARHAVQHGGAQGAGPRRRRADPACPHGARHRAALHGEPGLHLPRPPRGPVGRTLGPAGPRWWP